MTAISEILLKERQRQQKTLQEISDELNIKKEYLSILEAGAFDRIPGEVFVKGFIRNYGDYLGLDGSALVKEYTCSLQETVPLVVASEEKKLKIPAETTEKRKQLRRKQGKWPEISVIAGVLLFVLLCLWLFL